MNLKDTLSERGNFDKIIRYKKTRSKINFTLLNMKSNVSYV